MKRLVGRLQNPRQSCVFSLEENSVFYNKFAHKIEVTEHITRQSHVFSLEENSGFYRKFARKIEINEHKGKRIVQFAICVIHLHLRNILYYYTFDITLCYSKILF